MGVFEHFPYVNFHELNLSWIVNKIKELEDVIATQIVDVVARAGVAANTQAIQNLSNTVTANATTAHNEAMAAQNAAIVADGKAVAAQNDATAAGTTATAAQTALNAFTKYFKRFDFILAANGGTYDFMQQIVGSQTGIVIIQPRGLSVNNVGKVYLWRANTAKTSLWLTDLTSGVTSTFAGILSSSGVISNGSTTDDLHYDCLAYILYF